MFKYKILSIFILQFILSVNATISSIIKEIQEEYKKDVKNIFNKSSKAESQNNINSGEKFNESIDIKNGSLTLQIIYYVPKNDNAELKGKEEKEEEISDKYKNKIDKEIKNNGLVTGDLNSTCEFTISEETEAYKTVLKYSAHNIKEKNDFEDYPFFGQSTFNEMSVMPVTDVFAA